VEQGPANGGNAGVGARIRYEHTLRALERQANVLSELRSRASIILSATGITASLFGVTVLESHTPEWRKWLALSLVALGLLACIGVLLPVHDRGPMPADPRNPGRRVGRSRARRWKVTPSISELKEATAHGSEPAILDAIVVCLAPARRLNYRTLEKRSRALLAAAGLLLLQVCVWSWALLAR
jgi:hypothetical protein